MRYDVVGHQEIGPDAFRVQLLGKVKTQELLDDFQASTPGRRCGTRGGLNPGARDVPFLEHPEKGTVVGGDFKNVAVGVQI